MIPRSRLQAACALALLALLSLPAVALGHAELVSSDPPDGGTLSEPPHRLIAEFDEELGGRSRIVVYDAAGAEVADGGVSEEDAHVLIVDLSGIAPGVYNALWRAVTPSDNGITRGQIQFTLVEPASPSPPAGSPTPAGPTASPTVGATPANTPVVAPTATPLPNPTPIDGQPAAGTTDLLIALVLAGALIAAIVFFLWRRRA